MLTDRETLIVILSLLRRSSVVVSFTVGAMIFLDVNRQGKAGPWRACWSAQYSSCSREHRESRPLLFMAGAMACNESVYTEGRFRYIALLITTEDFYALRLL